MNIFDRRELILAGLASGFLGTTALAQPQTPPSLQQLEEQLGGRIGLAALDTGSGKSLSWRAGERFVMCSSYKWVLGAAILTKVDRGQLTLDHQIYYSPEVLLDYSPITRLHVNDGRMSVVELCGAAVEFSDNTAANLLLALAGGPPGFTQYLREIGDTATRLDRNEPSLNTNIPGDERDTTTPGTMLQNMNKILVKDALSSPSRDKLLDWMRKSQTGIKRLHAGLPPDWVEGDKTGTGANGAAVDNAIIWPPNRAPIMVAAYLSGSIKSSNDLDAAHAKVGQIISTMFA